MLSKLTGNIFSLFIARFENVGNVFKAKKSSKKATVFPQENMSFVNDFNEQNPNKSAPPAAKYLNVN